MLVVEATSIDSTSNGFKYFLHDFGIKYSDDIAEQHNDVNDYMRTFVSYLTTALSVCFNVKLL